MKVTHLVIHFGAFLVLFGFAGVNGANDTTNKTKLFGNAESSDCRRLQEECDLKDPQKQCCPIGTCERGYCSSGILGPMMRQMGLPGEELVSDRWAQANAITRELETLERIDVSNHPNLKLLPKVDDCGYSSVNLPDEHERRKKRIVGGDAVKMGAYPWMVQLYLHNITYGNTYFHCGGTIINKRHILTAAHCLTRIPTATTLKAVTIGTTDRRQTVECDNGNTTCSAAFRYLIQETIVHENYSEGNVRHDIGLIRLNRDIDFTDFARPICLPLSEEMFKKFEDGVVTVVGWGTQNKAQDEKPRVISWREQKVSNNLVSRATCDRFFSRVTGKIKRSQLCAGGYPGKGDCQGDSGGPLFKKLPIPIPGQDENANVTEENKRYYQFGIVSTGAVIDCGKQGRPSVYTSVMYYMPWILENLVPKIKIAICPSCTSTPQVNPKEELSTGLDINLLEHPNAKLLPRFPDCGPTPEFLRNTISIAAAAGFSDSVLGTKRVKRDAGEPKKRVKRVIGGRPFGLGSLAWMAQIYVRDSVSLDLYLRCSGFIISPKYVMTAAHCVTEINAPYALDSIVIGNYNRLKDKECLGGECSEKKFIPIEDVYVHEHFAKFTHENDIALIRLPEEIKFGRFLQPICLPMTEEILGAWTDRRFTTAGWGKVTNLPDSEYTTSNILHAVNITLQSRFSCDFIYSRQTGILDRSRLCGGGDPGKGECAGDSGGPMMKWVTGTNDNNSTVRRYYAFGIASFVECGEQGSPGIYTNIIHHMPWVLNRIEP